MPLDLLRLVPPVCLLLAALVVMVGLRRKALRSAAADPRAAWFAFTRAAHRLELALWLVWVAAVSVCRADAPLLATLAGTPRWLLVSSYVALILVPPSLAGACCTLLSYPVYRQVRGLPWTRTELVHRTAWKRLAFLAPALLAAVALGTWADGASRLALVLLVGSYVARRYCLARLWDVSGWSLRALTVGELRDRVFALACKAGADLRGVYVLTAGKDEEANAYALPGGFVYLSDHLLRHLSKREVDAIIAHEVAHLRLNRLRADQQLPWWGGLVLGLVFPGCWLGLVLSGWLAEQGYWELVRWLPVVLVLAWAVWKLLRASLSRGVERAADAAEVALTADAEASITALVKLDRLAWNRLEESAALPPLATHPASQRRVEAMAAQGGVPEDRLRQLLTAPEEDAERYSLPAEVTRENLLLSTAYKQRRLRRRGWALFAAWSLPPLLAAAYLVPLVVSPSLRWVLVLGGACTGFLVYELLTNYVSLGNHADLRRRWLDYLEGEKLVPDGLHVQFVAFAPAATPQLYENHAAWDVGGVVLTARHLIYLGERTRFALGRQQVSAIGTGPGMPHWWPLPRVIVSWHDAKRGIAGKFGLCRADVRSLRQFPRATAELANSLKNWHQEGDPPGAAPDACSELPSPSGEVVTAVRLRDAYSGRVFMQSIFRQMLLTGAGAFLLGLPFTDLSPGSAGVAVLSVTALAMLRWFPLWCHREPDPG